MLLSEVNVSAGSFLFLVVLAAWESEFFAQPVLGELDRVLIATGLLVGEDCRHRDRGRTGYLS